MIVRRNLTGQIYVRLFHLPSVLVESSSTRMKTHVPNQTIPKPSCNHHCRYQQNPTKCRHLAHLGCLWSLAETKVDNTSHQFSQDMGQIWILFCVSIFRMPLKFCCFLFEFGCALNPVKPGVLFMGHRQTVHNQIRRRRGRRLIWFSTVCLQNVLLVYVFKI